MLKMFSQDTKLIKQLCKYCALCIILLLLYEKRRKLENALFFGMSVSKNDSQQFHIKIPAASSIFKMY